MVHIDQIHESKLHHQIRFPVGDGTARALLDLRKAHPLTVTDIVWLKLRATYSESIEEVYNSKAAILLFNN